MKNHGKIDRGGWERGTLGNTLLRPGSTQWGCLWKGGKIFLFPEAAPRNPEWAGVRNKEAHGLKERKEKKGVGSQGRGEQVP